MQPHCLVRKARRRRAHAVPLLFVHGAFAGAWCWDEHFLGYFSALGHDAWAVDLRGHGMHAAAVNHASLEDYVSDVVQAVAHIGRPPVLVGHSMGAIITQRVCRQIRIPAQILMAPVPPQGVMASSFALALKNPEIFNIINNLQLYGASLPTPGLLRQALFSPQMPLATIRRYLGRMCRESQRALFDLSWPQYGWIDRATMPLLVLAAQIDILFPPPVVRETAQWHGVDATIVPGLAHAMMLDEGWEQAAAVIAGWLESCGL